MSSRGSDSDRHEITKIGITKEGRWYLTEAKVQYESVSGAGENRPDNDRRASLRIRRNTESSFSTKRIELPQSV